MNKIIIFMTALELVLGVQGRLKGIMVFHYGFTSIIKYV